jgi:hypothetical protein
VDSISLSSSVARAAAAAAGHLGRNNIVTAIPGSSDYDRESGPCSYFLALSVQEKQDLVTAIYSNHPTQQSIKGTAWGVYNAVVAYNDHVIEGHNTARSSAQENRMLRIATELNITDRALALLGAK